jgi:hypothetical protein
LRLARALILAADKKQCPLELYFLYSTEAKSAQSNLDNLLGPPLTLPHTAVFVPTDNLIWLPKDEEKESVAGARIPDVLRKWVRPLWQYWPCDPTWISPNLARSERKRWIDPESYKVDCSKNPKWRTLSSKWRTLRELTPPWWRTIALGISMGVPQLHRVARREGFASIEVGDWFFSVGLRGCMEECSVPPDVIATTEPDLRMIAEDEFKAREFWPTLFQAPYEAYKAHLADSPVGFREMTGILWTGDPLPNDYPDWRIAADLRGAIDNDVYDIRGTKADCVACILTGKTGVWDKIVKKLLELPVHQDGKDVAVIDVDRGTGEITLLEGGGKTLPTASSHLQGKVLAEERRLATSCASDFGIARSAGGVLSLAATHRASVFVDEPGHWLGRIQREQCHKAGLCVIESINQFRNDPYGAIQRQSQQIRNPDSPLARTAVAAARWRPGAERDLAEYLLETYVQ